jgi:hypothetical protein
MEPTIVGKAVGYELYVPKVVLKKPEGVSKVEKEITIRMRIMLLEKRIGKETLGLALCTDANYDKLWFVVTSVPLPDMEISYEIESVYYYALKNSDGIYYTTKAYAGITTAGGDIIIVEDSPELSKLKVAEPKVAPVKVVTPVVKKSTRFDEIYNAIGGKDIDSVGSGITIKIITKGKDKDNQNIYYIPYYNACNQANDCTIGENCKKGFCFHHDHYFRSIRERCTFLSKNNPSLERYYINIAAACDNFEYYFDGIDSETGDADGDEYYKKYLKHFAMAIDSIPPPVEGEVLKYGDYRCIVQYD